MKKTIKSLFAIAVAAFAFTACSDVPAPEGYNENTGDGKTVVDPAGTGTATDPYNVAGVNAFAQTLAVGETTTQDVYTKGYVSTVKQFRSNYNSLDYYISDVNPAEGKGEEFYVYSGQNLGNTPFSSINDLKVGDVVIVCGKITNYNGTIEYQSRNYIVELNGQTSGGGGGGTVDPAGTGTETDPFNVAAAIKKCQETGTTATTEKYYIKGIAASDYTVGSYHNVEVGIVDEGASDVFKVYRCKGNNSKDIPEGYKVNKGDVIIVYGPVVNFSGNTPETATGAYIVSINGVDPASADTPTPQPSGNHGTAEAPLTVAQAIAVIDAESTASDCYVKGIISKVDSYNATYKSITYWISDDGGKTTQLQVYSGKGLNGADFAAKEDLAVGQTVVVKGNLKKYNDTYEFDKTSSIISINGEGGGGNGGNDNPQPTTNHGTAEAPITVAQAIAVIDAESTASDCYVKGIICQVDSYNATYKSITYWISDDGQTTTKLQVYSGKGLNGADFSAKEDLTTGKTVIVKGNLKKYGSTYEFDKTSSIISMQ